MRRKITDLREKRATVYEGMKALLDATEGRDMTAEESQDFDRRESEFDTLTRQIERMEKVEGFEPAATRDVIVGDTADGKVDERAVSAFEQRQAMLASDEYRAAFEAGMRAQFRMGDLTPEQRAALSLTAANGGYTVPSAFLKELIISERDFGVMRQLATVIVTENDGTLSIPSVSSTRATAAWTAEASAFTESEDTFGQVQLAAFKAGVLAKLSDEVIHDSAFDLLGFVARSSGEALGVLENTSYMTGASDSTTTPEGLMTKATVGVTLPTGNTTSITADGLFDAFHSILPPYRKRGVWLFNDATIKALRKLKNAGNVDYLWQPGLAAGQPDTILGRPVYADPDVATMAADALCGGFGDVKSAYIIRDVQDVTVKVLNELYAATGQVGYRVHKRTDGDLADSLAFKTIKNSAT